MNDENNWKSKNRNSVLIPKMAEIGLLHCKHQVLLLQTLNQIIGPDNATVVSQTTLARKTLMSVSTVSRNIKELRDMDLIASKKHTAHSGNRVNSYSLTLPGEGLITSAAELAAAYRDSGREVPPCSQLLAESELDISGESNVHLVSLTKATRQSDLSETSLRMTNIVRATDINTIKINHTSSNAPNDAEYAAEASGKVVTTRMSSADEAKPAKLGSETNEPNGVEADLSHEQYLEECAQRVRVTEGKL